MGNVHSGSALTRTTIALDSFVAELGGDIIFDKTLGSARFLKTVRCKHRNGYLVVKVFVKPVLNQPLREHHRRLKVDREALADIANIYNYQAFVETEKAGYIIRQWVSSNLYDRISTRPFLSLVEKKWIAFQLLNALRDARNRKIPHGDIKSENILVTSWNWIYLTDFASYKPTYLPLDDPAEFSFYFDISGRRTCYLAPERFYTDASNPEISAKKARVDGLETRKDGVVTQAMDCFSAGCVIAELFLEGAPLFTLSQLFKYREGEYRVDSDLAMIEDVGVQNLIRQMIELDPAQRPGFDTLLHTSRGTVFPESFYSFLHNYVSSINDRVTEGPSLNSPSVPPVAQGTITPSISGNSLRPSHASTLGPTGPSGIDSKADAQPNDSDHRISRIWSEYESIEPYITPESLPSTEMDVRVEMIPSMNYTGRPYQDILPVELHIPNRESSLRDILHGKRRAATEDGPALIILALVTSNIRSCTLPSSKIHGLDVFLALACRLTDEAKLDRMVPYIVELLHDDAALVRSAALRTLMQVLVLVTVITPSNIAIFPEYIIPNIKHLVQDPETSVRCTYAQCIVQLAETAFRYLEMGQALKAHGAFQLSSEAHEYESANFEISFDASMQELQTHIQEHLTAILMDPSSIVKRAVLHDISSLCIFLGRQRTNDVLLSHMITYLNDKDWMLRYAFFESIVDVAACAGGRSLEEYILPLTTQALSDVEESVIAKVLAALTSLCELGLFQKMKIWELMSTTLGFLYHPNIWIRQGTAAFITSAAQHLPPSDIWCILYPSLRHFMKSDVVSLDEQSLLTTLKPPLPRQILDAAVQWAIKGDRSAFWKGPKRATATSNRVDSPRESMIALKRGGSTTISRNHRTEEDEAQISKLQQLGMTSSDETKLQAMRDYINKLANATSSFASRLIINQDPDTGKNLKMIGNIELQKLGVVPQTVFLKSRSTGEMSTRSSRLSALSLAPPGATSRVRSTGTPSSIARTPILSPRHRMSTDVGAAAAGQGSGAPFEDLRRRLATINGSATSVSANNTPKDTRYALSPVPPSSTPSVSAGPSISSQPDRPPSPTESIVSTTASVSLRPTSRLQVGSTDVQKAAPAVGSSKTNATGLLEAHARLRSIDGSPADESGRSSPMSMSATLRGNRLARNLSALAISTYDGQEPGISNLLENLYLDNNRELQQHFGPPVHEGPLRRRNTSRQHFSSRDSAQKRIEATLVANLASHSDAITGIAVSPDHMFFVSSSDDKTVKVWDSARLERNVTSKPRQTYGQHHAKVKCVCILEGVHCFASAAEDGSLHVVRVHLTQSGSLPKYSKLQVVREHRMDNPGEYATCMTHYNTDAASNLVYTTTHSNISVLDLRTMRTLQTMENPRHHGPITALCLDRKRAWLVAGTSTGVLTLWDKRFGLLIKSWHVGTSCPGRSARIHQIVVHPSKGRGKWIMVGLETSPVSPLFNWKGTTTSPSSPTPLAGTNPRAAAAGTWASSSDRPSPTIVEVWDIENTTLVETFVSRVGVSPSTEPALEPSDPQDSSGAGPAGTTTNALPTSTSSSSTPGLAADATPAAAIASLIRSRQARGDDAIAGFNPRGTPLMLDSPQPPRPDVRAMLVGVEFGGFATTQRPDLLGGEGLDMGTRPMSRGYMITGSEDWKIRLWDLSKTEKTTVLTGLDSEHDKPSYSTFNNTNSGIPGTNAGTTAYVESWPRIPPGGSSNRPPQRISLITHTQQNLLKGHQDTITALACIDSPFRGGIISGDRAGVIKVWRVEQVEHN